MKIKKLFYLITVSTIAGCSWMREAPMQSVNQPNGFVSASINSENIESLPYIAWWSQFDDAQLNGLIESALYNNLDIGIAISNLDSARGQLNQVNLAWIPGISEWGGYSTNPAFGAPGSFVGLFPAYTLNIASLIQQGRLARYGVKYFDAAVDGARLEIIGAVSSSYFTLLSQQRQLLLLQEYNNDLINLVNLSRKKLDIGIQSDIELSGLQSQQKLIAAQMELTEHNIQLSSNSINYLLNKNPEKVSLSDNFAKFNFTQFNPGDLPSNVLQNRPDIRMAEYAVQMSHAKVGIDYASLFPAIQLDKFIALVNGSTVLSVPNQRGGFQDAYTVAGLEPSIFGAIEADKGAYNAQVYSYVQTVRKALKDTDNAFSANNRFRNNYLNIESAYALLDKKYTLQNNLYKSGIISYPELLQAKLAVDDMRIISNQAKLQHVTALVNLYQQLAGGYKYHNEESNYNKLNIDG